MHFPTRSFDWDLELAFLVYPNFGYFTQYLTEYKEPIGGPSQYYTENHNQLLKSRHAWAGQKKLLISAMASNLASLEIFLPWISSYAR